MTPGMQLTPSVRLVRPLGAGGMGTVWLGYHVTLSTQVVVKFIASALAESSDARSRFKREAAAAAAVKSPHVVQMLDYGVVDDLPFIVMERLDGEDLRARLDRERTLTLTDLEQIITQACKALGQTHKAKIIHRDVKPENIFLCKTDDGEPFVKLLDFGIAKRREIAKVTTTKTGLMIGTAHYMSPEQTLGQKEIDLRSDLWSLGVVAFEAMTGTKAFDAPNAIELAVVVINGAIPTPSKVNPSLPKAIDEWFARACARTVADRFSSAKEMADALRIAMQTENPVEPATQRDPEQEIVDLSTDGLKTPAPIEREAPKQRKVVRRGAVIPRAQMFRKSQPPVVIEAPRKARVHKEPQVTEVPTSQRIVAGRRQQLIYLSVGIALLALTVTLIALERC